MKKYNFGRKLAVAGLLAALVSQPVFADGIQKLGFINTERVYRESKQAQRIEQTLQKEFSARQARLQSMQREGETLGKQVADGKMSDAERQQMMQKLAVMGQQFRAEQAQLAEDYNLRRNEEFAALQQNANKIIVGLAKQEGYDLIIQDAVYVNSKFDITDKVINSLNQ